MSENPIIYVVDDDEGLRDSLQVLLGAHDMEVRGFSSAQAFLKELPHGGPGCVLIDVNMPGMTGIELLEGLMKRGFKLPCVVMTGFGQVPIAVRAMKLGALDFIEKPYESDQLLQCIRRGLEKCKSAAGTAKAGEAAERISKLTPRERDVLLHIAQGQSNKVIAHELGISPRTVEIHRARLMDKLSVASVADVVRLAIDAELLG